MTTKVVGLRHHESQDVGFVLEVEVVDLAEVVAVDLVREGAVALDAQGCEVVAVVGLRVASRSRARAEGVTDARSRKRFSAFDTTFCAITSTSKRASEGSTPCSRSASSVPRSSPGPISGSPASAIRRIDSPGGSPVGASCRCMVS